MYRVFQNCPQNFTQREKYAVLNNKSFLKIRFFLCLEKIKSCKGWNKDIMYLNTLYV
jgi:hypothetical protein